MQRWAGSDQALDLAFLRRCYWTILAAIALVGAFAGVYGSPAWAGHYVAIGLWTAVNALILARLLLAATARPKRRIEALLLAPAKIAWLACVVFYCMEWSPAPSAVAAGVLTPVGVFMLKFLGWLWVHTRPTAALSKSKAEARN